MNLYETQTLENPEMSQQVQMEPKVNPKIHYCLMFMKHEPFWNILENPMNLYETQTLERIQKCCNKSQWKPM